MLIKTTLILKKISKILALFKQFEKLVKGFEPPTYGLQIRCSTVELHQQLIKSFYLYFILY
jgi:hypothetical protein